MNIWKQAVLEARKQCATQRRLYRQNDVHLFSMSELAKLCDDMNHPDENEPVVSCNEELKERLLLAYKCLVDNDKQHRKAKNRKGRTIGFSQKTLSNHEDISYEVAMLFLTIVEVLFGITCPLAQAPTSSGWDGPIPFSQVKDFDPRNQIKTILKHTSSPEKQNLDSVEPTEQTPRSEYYICHYIRANRPDIINRKAYNNPGFGILELKPKIHTRTGKYKGSRSSGKWQKQREIVLSIYYSNNQKIETRGKCIETEDLKLFIRAEDEENQTLIQTQFSFTKSKFSSQLLIGTYSSTRRGHYEKTDRVPVSGVAVCESIDEQEINWACEQLSNLENINSKRLIIDELIAGSLDEKQKQFFFHTWAIRYFLGDKRFSALPGGEFSLDGVKPEDILPNNSYKIWHEKLFTQYRGTYEGYYLKTTSTTSEKPTFEKFYFYIQEDGRAIMNTENDLSVVYHGYIRITNSSGGLLGYFDYQPEFDYYRFELFLDKYNENRGDYLCGSFAGFENASKLSHPIAGRIILKKVMIIADLPTDPKEQKPQSFRLFDEGSSDQLYVLSLFDKDPVIKRFFKGEGKFFKDITGTGYWKEFFKDERDEPVKDDEYDAFKKFSLTGYTTFTYFDIGSPKKQEHLVEKGFLKIHSSGKVDFFANNTKYVGNIYLINKTFYIELKSNGQTPSRIYIIIPSVSNINDAADNSIEVAYGLCLTDSLYSKFKRIEARTIVMSSCQEDLSGRKTADFSERADVSKLIYPINKINRINTIQKQPDVKADVEIEAKKTERENLLTKIREWDNTYNGAVSYVMGSINRYVQTSKLFNEPFEPRTRIERKVNYHAACRLADLYGSEVDVKKKGKYFTDYKIYLRKAYLHGYAADSFSSVPLQELIEFHTNQQNIHNSDQNNEIVEMLQDIYEERISLKIEIETGCLKLPQLKNEVTSLWESFE